MIRWEVEVPALDPHAFDVLVSDILRWRDNPVRARWLQLLQPIAALPSKFAQAKETTARAEIMDEARQQLQNLGAARETSDRFLYSAANPIGEECFRECHFSIGEDLINEVTVEAEPWIDLWRDNMHLSPAGLPRVCALCSKKRRCKMARFRFRHSCGTAQC